MRTALPLLAALLASASTIAGPATAPLKPPMTVDIPAGPFLAGSSSEERAYAHKLDLAAYGHGRLPAAGWYERERKLAEATTGSFLIMLTPVTNADYARFIAATGHPAPDVDAATWASYRLNHPFERTRRHAWVDGRPPKGRADHPVVLVSHDDAEAYAAWLSEQTGQRWRLPTELEWEKAARGDGGFYFPWGDSWDPEALNSHDLGPFDTMPVGSFLHGGSVHGMLDAVGQVYQWTASPDGRDRFLVKGGSWDDKGCGACRPAARQAQPAKLKHIVIGFRLVRDLPPG